MKKKASSTPTLGPCSCKRGQQRDNCPQCEGTGQRIDFAALRAAKSTPAQPAPQRGSYRTADGKAQIEWELKPGTNGIEFSASGAFNRSGGQCINDIAKAYPGDPMVQRIAKVWREYHLNGMNSGTPQQAAEIRRRRALAEDYARKDDDAKRHFCDDACTEPNWHSLCRKFGHDSYYSWECAVLKESGLYEVPLPAGTLATGGFPPEVASGERGYRFGERWLYRAIPDEVLAEIASWIAAPQPAEPLHEAQAKQFLADHGLRCRITLSDTKPAPWGEGEYRPHYRVTISREATKAARLVFDFWGAATAGYKATPHCVLSCVASDSGTPETFSDFCSEYGEDEDSRKALQAFRRADSFAKRIRAFFTAGEMKTLQQIE